MYNRVLYRFIVSRVDEKCSGPNKLFEQFMNLYEEVSFDDIKLKPNFNYSSMNKKSIYIHASCKYPYDEEFDNEANAIMSGIEIADKINDKCLDMSQGKYFSKDGIVIVLDLVLVNNINCSDMIDELMEK